MINRSIVMGRLTHDPELKKTGSGTSVCTFRIAVERDFKSQNGERETDFLDIVAWKGTAEFVSKYFSKGRMIGVDGRIQSRRYEKDSKTYNAVEIVADQVYFGDSAPKKNENAEAPAPAGFYEEQADGPLPF